MARLGKSALCPLHKGVCNVECSNDKFIKLHKSLVLKASLALLQHSSALPLLKQGRNLQANQDRIKPTRKATTYAPFPSPHHPQNLSQQSESSAQSTLLPSLNSAYPKLQHDENVPALVSHTHAQGMLSIIFILTAYSAPQHTTRLLPSIVDGSDVDGPNPFRRYQFRE